MQVRSRTRLGLLLCLIGYLALMVVVVWWLVSVRRSTLAELASAAARGNWQSWRDDVARQQARPGPVQRRVPKSVEPPALVLMRDYFGVSLAGAITFATVLYWVVAWFIAGIASSGRPLD